MPGGEVGRGFRCSAARFSVRVSRGTWCPASADEISSYVVPRFSGLNLKVRGAPLQPDESQGT